MTKKKTQQSYPVLNNNGQVFNSPVYQDDNGNAYTVDDNGNAWYVERQNTFDNPIQLDDVNVYAPSPQYMLDNALSQYSTLSNDRNKVLNTSHRQYNTHLSDNAQRGAVSHNTWTKEHPNLDSWSYVPSAAVMATAAAPAAMAAGDAIAGTAMGQSIGNTLGLVADAASNSTWLPWVDAGLSSAFAASGLQDVANGNVTPETILDLAPMIQLIKPVYEAGKGLYNVANNGKYARSNFFSGFNNGQAIQMSDRISLDPYTMHSLRAKAKGYDPSKVQILNVDEPSAELDAQISRYAQTFGYTPSDALYDLRYAVKDLGNAASEVGKNLIYYNNRLPKSNYSAVFSHELEHALHMPSTPLPDGVMDPAFLNKYYTINNNTDIAARGSQIKDWLGLTGNEPITEADLRRAAKDYIKDTGIDNGMTEFFNAIRDYKGLADWLSKEATGIVPAAIIGNELYKSKTD